MADIESFVMRWTEQAWRITVGLHAGRLGADARSQSVAIETVQSAIRLADWFARQQLALLEGSRATARFALKDKLLGLLLTQPTGMTARDIYRRLRLKQAATQTLLAGLLADDAITCEEIIPKTGGHRHEVYKVKSR